ncbi:hypothetical protein [Streptomyces sp. NPDC012888]|uniref:hypothetical protein n=1 Tax=Streptomyces sp. NPDC012888 TaxID=3364855 RepID=UPI0036A30BC6
MTAPQTVRTSAGPRLIRAAVFAAVCVVLSAAGHAIASCAGVPWWAVGAAFLAVFAVAAPLAGRRRSLRGITAALAGGQVALHAVFGLGQHEAARAGAESARAASETSIAALAAQLICGGNAIPLSPARAREILWAAGIDPATAAVSAAGAGPHGGHVHAAAPAAAEPLAGLLGLPMLLGHLLAAVAAGWLLGRGDAALVRLVQLSRRSAEAVPVRALRSALALVRALCAGLPGEVVALPRTRRGSRNRDGGPGREALQHTVIRRGPPAAAYALAA